MSEEVTSAAAVAIEAKSGPQTVEGQPRLSGTGVSMPPVLPTLSAGGDPMRLPHVPARRILRSPAHPLLVAAGLGGMFDALFNGQQPGIGLPIFILLGVIGLLGLGWNEGVPVNRWATVVTALPLLFFAGMVAVRDNGLLVFQDICAVVLLTCLLAHFYSGGDLTRLSVGRLLGVPWLSFGNALISGVIPLRDVARASRMSIPKQRTMALLRGLLISVPLVCVLLPLLLSADAVFADRANKLIAWFGAAGWNEVISHGLVILAAAWLIAGGLTYAITRTAPAADNAAPEPGRPLGFIEGMTPLAVIAILFAAFVIVQFACLFGGDRRVQTIPGLTYAQYAHQGFAELVVVATLTLLIAGLWCRLMARETVHKEFAFRFTITALIAMTLVMLASAHLRMSIYEAAYGDSALRLYVDVFIFFLGLTLAWFAVSIWSGTYRYFVFGMYLCAIGYLFTLNIVNPDRLVASQNLDRAQREHRPIHANDFAILSDDAIPVLCAAMGDATPQDRGVIAAVLRERLRQRSSERARFGWPSRNLSRYEAFRQLEGQPFATAAGAALQPKVDPLESE